MGMTHAELTDGIDCGGVATCPDAGLESGLMLFI